MCQGAGALQLSKDRILVCEQVANKTVAVALVHAQSRLLSWTEDAWRKSIGQGGHISLIRRRQLNETGEVGAHRIKGSDVGQTQLTKSRLEDRNPRLLSDVRSGSAVDGLDNLIYVR